MTTRIHTSRRGVTLLELVAAITVLSIIAAVVMPVIISATESYATARTLRSSTESLAFASDQLQRVIRSAPSGAGGEGLGVSVGTTQRIEFSDGTGFELDGTDLSILVPGADPALICRDVESFTISYIAADGSSNAISTPTEAHRIGFMIQCEGSVVSGVAFPRVWIGQGGV
ncbi:MAG: prepilin-type N-terminal cleavage/methylation domain-containing protein [Phycisphaerales bacterium]|nr:prepilin-type N-terminal cleavage/methylation domain-containing protein [Phycisphaerales bacterium]